MGRRIQCTLPDTSKIEYGYDGHYLYEVKRGGYCHTYKKRNLEGEIIKSSLPDFQEITIDRDKLGRYSNYRTPYFSASNLTYDGQGNLLSYQYQDSLGKENCQFSYDELDQLTSENQHTYHFDSLYNRLKKDNFDYTNNDLCQIKCDGVANYTYDACGNLTSDGTNKFTYDSLDRLIQVENDGQSIEYTYDPFNRRLSKTVFSKNKKIKHIRYIWDGENEIGTVDEKNNIQELRILGEGLGAEIGSAVLYELNGKSYIPIHDHRGCVVALADFQKKKSVESYRYSAFGEELTGHTLSPWRFASKRTDSETNLVFFGRRYYNPSLGRFITQDPEGFEDGPNLYAYLKNCPLNDIDLYGLFAWGNMWGGTKDFFGGAGQHAWNGVRGIGHGIGKMGEWGHAEYFKQGSFFQNKPQTSTQGWKELGKAIWQDPIGTFTPGVKEAWNNPTSPSAWGKAAVDVGLWGFTAFKMGSAAANLGRAGRIGAEASSLGRVGNASIGKVGTVNTENILLVDRSTSFMGRRGRLQLDYAPYQRKRNPPACIRGRNYSGHSMDRMQDRGYFPSVIEDTVKHGIRSPGNDIGTLRFYNSVEKFSVIINEKTGNVITIIPGVR